jgi:hypothetical protein
VIDAICHADSMKSWRVSAFLFGFFFFAIFYLIEHPIFQATLFTQDSADPSQSQINDSISNRTEEKTDK